jgi:hypothetical protein
MVSVQEKLLYLKQELCLRRNVSNYIEPLVPYRLIGGKFLRPYIKILCYPCHALKMWVGRV